MSAPAIATAAPKRKAAEDNIEAENESKKQKMVEELVVITLVGNDSTCVNLYRLADFPISYEELKKYTAKDYDDQVTWVKLEGKFYSETMTPPGVTIPEGCSTLEDYFGDEGDKLYNLVDPIASAGTEYIDCQFDIGEHQRVRGFLATASSSF